MRASVLIAGLSAAAAYATPLMARSSTPAPGPSSASVAPPAPTASVAKPYLAGNPAATPNPVAEANFVGMLLDTPTQVDRFNALQDEVTKGKTDFKFDFNPAANPGVVPGEGGAVFLANRKAFPAVTELGISGAGLFFSACGLNTPHTHPRATEFLTVATNSTILAGFVLENGFNTEVNETLTQFQGMVFPQGSIHWQQNLDCEPAVAIAALNSDDPGASSVANRFFQNTNPDVVLASLGFPQQITPQNFAQFKANIPTPFVRGVEECYKRCGIKY